MPNGRHQRRRPAVRRFVASGVGTGSIGAAAARLTVTVLLLAGVLACGTLGTRAYEYEEVLYLSLDGSATLFVNGSVPAFVALRGLDLDVHPRARLDREALRAAYSSPVTRVTRVGSSRRLGRRFAHLRIEVHDVRRLAEVAPLAWSGYTFEQRGGVIMFRQIVGGSAQREVGRVGWTGAEIAAFRLHSPSKIHYHNAPSREVSRGNFLEWEQPLRARLAGEPIAIDVRLDTRTILYRTLWLFGAMVVLVLALFAGVIAWMVRARRTTGRPASPFGD